MTARDNFRELQKVLGIAQTGIPNDETKFAFQKAWNTALAEYRASQGQSPNPTPEPGRIVDPGLLSVDSWGWISGVERQLIPGGSPLEPICLVIHFTAGATGQSSIDYWKSEGNGVCAHIVIERNGKIIQCRSFSKTCAHAGESIWVDPVTGRKHRNISNLSIGIEMANAGDSIGALRWAKRQPGYVGFIGRHRNDNEEKEWETFPAAQIESCMQVTQALMATYQLHDITGHDCIAPSRRSDPGPAFPMESFRRAFGFTGLPVVHRS